MLVTIPFWVALILSLVLVPVTRNVGLRLGIVDAPKIDRWHKKPTSKVGGIAIFLSFSITIIIVLLIFPDIAINWALLVGSLIAFVIGILDDNWPLSPGSKLIGQILASAIVILFGRNLDFFDLEILNILFTLGWLVGITNAINLLDNMDGLAGGVSLIAALMLSLMFWQVGSIELLLIALTLGGGILGFLFFNFPPATVFMGDGGSLFIGFTLAALSIAHVPRASNLLAILGVPTLIFLLPILDTTMVTITRILRGQSPAQGGKDHTSHRLIAFGLSERQTVLVLYGVALLSGIIGTLLESLDYNVSLLLFPILLLLFTMLTAYIARIKVVHTPSPIGQTKAFSRFMKGLTGKWRLFEILLDLVLICVAFYLAFLLYYGGGYNILSFEPFIRSLPITIAAVYISFIVFGIYRGIWQYIALKDLIKFFLAVVGSAIAIFAIQISLYSLKAIPFSIMFLFCVFLFMGLAATRVSFRLLDQLLPRLSTNAKERDMVLILGADETGVMILQWLSNNLQFNYNVIGFLDNDSYKLGRQIQGTNIVGQLSDISTIVEKYEFQGIILPNDDTAVEFLTSGATEICKKNGIWIKRFDVKLELVE